MERREFFAAAGALSVPAVGCGTALHNVPNRALSDAEADAILARLESSQADGTDTHFVSEVVARILEEPVSADRYEAADALADAAIRSLLIGDALGAIPRDATPPAALVERFASLAPELGEAVVAQAALFERTPARAKQRIDDAMRGDGRIAMRVGEVIDDHARRAGVSSSGLGKMRRILAELDARSRLQSFSLVTDECVAKVRRVAALHGEDMALARALRQSTAAAAFWSQAAPPPPATTTGSLLTATPRRRVRAPLTPAQRRARYERFGTMATAGGVMGILGAALWGVGWGLGFEGSLASGATAALLIGGTVGALVAIAGLVLLIVGSVLRARYRDP